MKSAFAVAGVATLLASTTARAEPTRDPSKAGGRSDAASVVATTPIRRPVVVVVATSKNESLPLLRAELQELGLEIVEVPFVEEEGEPPSTIEPQTGEDFRVILRATHVEVRMFERGTGKVTLRDVFAQSDGTALDTRTAALHAVELLRWRLHERRLKARASARAAPASPRPPAVRSSARPWAWLISLAPQVRYSPGGTEPGVGVQLDVAWRWSRMAARVFASTALVPNELTSRDGSAQVTSRLVGLQGVLMSTAEPTTSGVEANVGLGVALLSSQLQGRANSAYRAHDDQLLTASPVLDLRVGYVVNRSLALVVQSSALAPLRSSSLRFGDREAGRYGWLVIDVGIGPRISVF